MAKKIMVISNPPSGLGRRSIEVYSDIEGEIEVKVFWPKKEKLRSIFLQACGDLLRQSKYNKKGEG